MMEKQKPNSDYYGNKSSKNEPNKNKFDIIGIWRNFSFYGVLTILI